MEKLCFKILKTFHVLTFLITYKLQKLFLGKINSRAENRERAYQPKIHLATAPIVKIQRDSAELFLSTKNFTVILMRHFGSTRKISLNFTFLSKRKAATSIPFSHCNNRKEIVVRVSIFFNYKRVTSQLWIIIKFFVCLIFLNCMCQPRECCICFLLKHITRNFIYLIFSSFSEQLSPRAGFYVFFEICLFTGYNMRIKKWNIFFSEKWVAKVSNFHSFFSYFVKMWFAIFHIIK